MEALCTTKRERTGEVRRGDSLKLLQGHLIFHLFSTFSVKCLSSSCLVFEKIEIVFDIPKRFIILLNLIRLDYIEFSIARLASWKTYYI